jgi:hypothetical protein
MSSAKDAADSCGVRGAHDLREADAPEERVEVSDRGGQDARRRSGTR